MEIEKKRDEKALKEEQEMRKMQKMLLNLEMAEMVVDLDLLQAPPKATGAPKEKK